MVGRLADDQQENREDELRELEVAIHREQDERYWADDEDYLDALNGSNEYTDKDYRERDDNPYDQ